MVSARAEIDAAEDRGYARGMETERARCKAVVHEELHANSIARASIVVVIQRIYRRVTEGK